MRITHICLCGAFTDGWTYQENYLTKYHRKLGHEVSVITSKYIRNENADLVIDNRDSYVNEHGVKVIRIKNKFNTSIKSKFKLYENLYTTLLREKPDIIFIHNIQFLNIWGVTRYLKKHPQVVAYADNHTDFSNSASNWISKVLLHGIIWRRCALMIEPYLRKFYGVLPSRVDFLKNVYKIPERKIELLLMGADDEKVKEANQKDLINQIRKRHQINNEDFLIVTGGKIDQAKKQTLLLMEAIKNIESPNVKLIVFGPVVESLKEKFNSLVDNDKVKHIGWINGEESYKYFAAANLVVFPGRHSVFWEQVAGQGIPMVVKHWEGTTHVNIGGNCKFLYEDSVEEIKQKIIEVIKNKEKYENQIFISSTVAKKHFSYYEISKKSIEE
ncbi:glycosyltransferase family 4 protein [Rossellomorea aquimaris]|uniref:glycosyltransferase family 4 protein n=1 Tax=Rossellomorea aquimaris TaxID=189382 RepID=UPI001CD5B954|nr:glycosyltransferase family 4 protein [Rossellomorea aquimaris]MCA1060856.1 glycosyltransferase family 4 protein [Rossellomorea aquimaris]